jgi:hypothetical protein
LGILADLYEFRINLANPAGYPSSFERVNEFVGTSAENAQFEQVEERGFYI